MPDLPVAPQRPTTLTWLLRVPGSARPRRLTVVVEPGARLGDLRHALHDAVPDAARHTPIVVAGRPLDDDALLGHPPLLQGATLTLGGPTRPPAARPLLAVHVVCGPDTGAVVDLPPGRHRVGRAAEASVRLTDPDVSRVHALLEVSGGSVAVHDLGSGNGTEVDGIPVGAVPATASIGARVALGSSTLVLRTPDTVPAAVHADGRGHLLVHRQPAPGPAPSARQVEFPDRPTDPAPARLPVLALVLPATMSAAAAALLHTPTLLLFGLMSPVLVAGQWVADRRGNRRDLRARHADYHRAHAAATRRLDEALAAETVERLAADPDPAQLLVTARRPGARLWERDLRRDGLRARVGMAVVDPRTTTTSQAPVCRLGPVPVDVALDGPGGVGVCGPRERTLQVARGIVGTVAARYSPAELHITVLHRAEDAATWSWATLLPHHRPVRETLGDPSQALEPRDTPWTLVVVDAAASWRRRPEALGMVTDGLRRRCAVLSLEPTAAHLPADTHAVVDLTAPGAVLRVAGHPPLPVEVDTVTPGWAWQLAHAMTALRDAGAPAAATAPGHDVSLLALLGMPDPDGGHLVRRWQHRPNATAVPLGVDPGTGDPVLVDLATDGPHALVGGTTGSGKSELLTCLVAALAAVNRPDELALVLVDFKGGAAFEGCRGLPHVVGLVTDLDPSLAERALVSLTAELRRRERVLAARAATDYAAYRRHRAPTDPALPRLVVVVDEFRALADELAGFVDGLVRVAAQGRSLGLHLVVATQRPGGVVSADLRANLGLRVALRVRDAVDSLELIDAPDAARLPADAPGRALLQGAGSGRRVIQTARVSGRTPPTSPARVTHVDGMPVADSACGPTDLARLVVATRAATETLGIGPVPSPWLAPLPPHVPLSTLPAGDGAASIGLADDPGGQRQIPLTWCPATDGNLAVVGRSRTGRSTAVRTIAVALARSSHPTDLHLYAVHLGGLATLPPLPHLAGAMRADDPADLERLLAVLETRPAGPEHAPLRVLLVDDWDRTHAGLLAARRPGASDALTALARSGPATGLVVVSSGDRSMLGGATATAFPRRIVLLPADPLDLGLAGVPTRTLPREPPLGRAIDTGSGLTVHIAEVDPAALQRYPAKPADHPLMPEPLQPLPTRIAAEALIATRTTPVPVGLGGPRLSVQGFDPEAGDRRIAVLGERGSGRTTALVTLAWAIATTGRPTALVSTGAADTRTTGAHHLAPSEIDSLVALRRAHPDLAVLVDEVPGVDEGPLAPVLAEIERRLDEDHGVLVVAGSARRVVESGLGLLARVARHGCGLLLGTGQPGDERALGRHGIPACGAARGRAVLVRAGQATAVHVAQVSGTTTRPR